MQYFVIGPDGTKYGPADVNTLSEWARDNRVAPNTVLEDFTTGQRMPASSVPGVLAPIVQPSNMGGPNMGGQQGTPYEQPQQQYGGYTQYPRQEMAGDSTKTMIMWSWICSGVGVLCCPIGFSTAGIVLAAIAGSKGYKNWPMPVIAGVLSLIVGTILGVVANPFFKELFTNMNR